MQYVDCDFCGEDNYKLVLGKERIPFAAGPVVRCRQCGLIYVNPRMEEKQWYHYKDLFDWYKKVAEINKVAYNAHLGEIEKYKKRPGKLLEIGCYGGGFLGAAQERGWECFGVEPHADAARYASAKHKVKIYNSFLEEAGLEPRSFDVVVMFHVLEHISSPSLELRRIRKILKSDGLLVIEVPDERSLFNRFFKNKRLFYSPGHFYYFRRETLKMLLQKEKFSVLGVRNGWRPSMLKLLPAIIDRKGYKRLSNIAQSVFDNLNFFDYKKPYKTRTSFVFYTSPPDS